MSVQLNTASHLRFKARYACCLEFYLKYFKNESYNEKPQILDF